jgi:AcrR family transcriptional regulator
MKRAITNESKSERRSAILAVALDVFYENGFNAARMDDIATRAELSKGTLYLYFDTKDALFKALIDSLAIPNLGEIEKIAAAAPSVIDALDGLAMYAPNMIRHSNMPRLMKVLIGDSQNFPAIIVDYRVRILDRLIGALTLLLKNGKLRGEIETDDPALLARLLIAPIAFSGIWQAVFGGASEATVDLERLFQMHIKIMIKALTPQRDPLGSQFPDHNGVSL